MRYRSAAFARLSAHALAGDGSTHFPARGVDADALFGGVAVLEPLANGRTQNFSRRAGARRARRASIVEGDHRARVRKHGRCAVAQN